RSFLSPPTASNYTLSLHDALPILHPDMGTSSDYLERYWNFDVATGLGSYTYSAELHYDQDDVVGNEAAMLANYWDGGDWNAIPSDRKSTRLNSSHVKISYAVFCLK